MAKSDTLETGILKLVYQNIDLANIGDAAGLQNSATAGSIWLALFTTATTDAAAGTEATYTGYTRIALVRSAVGWTVADNVVSNASIVTFPTNSGTIQTVTHVATMTASSGGDFLHHGQLSAPLIIDNGNIPKFEIGDFSVTEN